MTTNVTITGTGPAPSSGLVEDAQQGKVPSTPATTLRCRTVAAGGSKQFNYVRDLPPLAVEERLGPSSEAPVATPSETLLAAFGSCLAARIHANAASGSIALRSLTLEVEADVAMSPMWAPIGEEPSAIGFEAIRVNVLMDADASPEALRALIAHAVLWSPVANTLHGPVHLDVALDQTSGLVRDGRL